MSVAHSSGLTVTSASCVVWPTLAYNYTCTPPAGRLAVGITNGVRTTGLLLLTAVARSVLIALGNGSRKSLAKKRPI